MHQVNSAGNYIAANIFRAPGAGVRTNILVLLDQGFNQPAFEIVYFNGNLARLGKVVVNRSFFSGMGFNFATNDFELVFRREKRSRWCSG